MQILHCLKQSDEGGESLFSDGFRAVYSALRFLYTVEKRSQFVAALSKWRLPFHYKNNGYWLSYSHPTLAIDEEMDPHTEFNWALVEKRLEDPYNFVEALQAVRWSPPFQGPIAGHDYQNIAALNHWMSAAWQLREQFHYPPAIYQTKLEEGTCVIFDNSRILHGRTAFSGSERWLRGAYIDEATFTQQLLRLDIYGGSDGES